MDAHNIPSDDGVVNAVLEGGPSDLAEPLRVRCVAVSAIKIKICHRGGYEHFERDGRPGDGDQVTPVVFRWTARTAIAE